MSVFGGKANMPQFFMLSDLVMQSVAPWEACTHEVA